MDPTIFRQFTPEADRCGGAALIQAQVSCHVKIFPSSIYRFFLGTAVLCISYARRSAIPDFMGSQKCLTEARPVKRTPPNGTRLFKGRTTTACVTCKARRIKCGEEKPSCIRCTSTGRRCDWMQPPSHKIAWPALPPTTVLFDSEQEHRSFNFFCHNTVTQLGGVFASEFWERLVLQTTHHEPCIRHAAVALGAVHELFQSHDGATGIDGDEERTQFAIQQYSKSIGYLVKPMSVGGKQAADVTLMNCILFVLFETIRGHHGAAIHHLQGGIRILTELQSSSNDDSKFETSSTPYAPLSVFDLMFSSLDNQAMTIEHRVQSRLPKILIDSGPNVPQTFSSLKQARFVLGPIRTGGLLAIQEVFNGMSTNGTPIEQILISLEIACACAMIKVGQWKRALENWKRATGEILDERTRDALHIVQMHAILTKLSFSVDQVRALVDDLTWDSFIPDFEAIVKHAAAVVRPMAISRMTRQRIPLFWMDTGIILPLYFVAVKCPDRKIRHEAVELLKADQRQEGIWNRYATERGMKSLVPKLHIISSLPQKILETHSKITNSRLAARVAERLIEVEEEGLGEDDEVPVRKRIRCVDFRFGKEGRGASLQYKKLNSQNVLEVIEEWIGW